MNWIDTKYALMLCGRFRNFQRVSDTVFAFSCPICGDSKKSPRRARGSITEGKDGTWYSCWKCSANMPFGKFLQDQDPRLWEEYQRERITEGLWKGPRRSSPPALVSKPAASPQSRPVHEPLCHPLEPLKRLDVLGPGHQALRFVHSRKIPDPSRLYHCPRFMAWVNWLIPDKFSKRALHFDEPRLIIPFFDKNQTLIAFQGRSYKPDSEVKYITIALDGPLIYGLDTVDETKTITALEGPIDSMFVDNAVAFAGGSYSALKRFDKKLVTVAYDNEPRKPETQKKVWKAIADGYAVCLWPSYVVEKDVNDMVKSGSYSIEAVNDMIRDNTHSGLSAEMEFYRWKK